MTLHKLTAGDGYTYLTRQVASADQRRAGQSLADYYAATGNPPAGGSAPAPHDLGLDRRGWRGADAGAVRPG